MKTIKTSKLIQQQNIASSITIIPLEKECGYNVRYFLKQRNSKGCFKVKNIKVDKIIEDVEIPQISNANVLHLGFHIHKYLQNPSGFYINLYKK